MDKLTQQIKKFNEIYFSMNRNFIKLQKMFKKDSNISSKIILAENILNQVYMSIVDKFESESINTRFFKIIKNIKERK